MKTEQAKTLILELHKEKEKKKKKKIFKHANMKQKTLIIIRNSLCPTLDKIRFT